MHVLQLGPYPPPEGGISRNMLAIRDELVKLDHRCSIVAISKSSHVREEADVHHPRSALGLVKLLATLDFDVLHLHIGGDISRRILALALAASIFGRGRSVLTVHSGGYPLSPAARHATPNSLQGRILRRFSRVIAVNEPISEVFHRFGLRPDRIKVICPYSLQRPDEKVTVPTSLADFVGRHSPLLISVGGLERDYDPLFQIAAMDYIVSDFPNAGLLMVGDGSMRREVEHAAANSGHNDVIYVAGNVEHAITLHLINNSDVLLRTTLFDGDAISVREALLMGTPVIATDNGMRPDGVHLIRPGDLEDLARKVREVTSDTREKHLATESDSSNIVKVIDLYNELLVSVPPSTP